MRRHGFELRLALTFLLALAAAVAVQYVLAGRLVAGEIIQEETAERAAEASVLTRALSPTAPGGDRPGRPGQGPVPGHVHDLLADLRQRDGLTRVRLVDASGTVIAAGDPTQMGSRADVPERVRAAVEEGRSFAGPTHDRVADSSAGGHHFEYVVPVPTPAGRLALEVDQELTVVQDLQGALRRGVLGSLALWVRCSGCRCSTCSAGAPWPAGTGRARTARGETR